MPHTQWPFFEEKILKSTCSLNHWSLFLSFCHSLEVIFFTAVISSVDKLGNKSIKEWLFLRIALDWGRFPFAKRLRKILETSLGNAYRRKTCSILHTRPFHPRLPSPSDVFPAKIQNGGTTVIVERMLDFSLADEGLFNSDDDDNPFLAAVATYMRRHLPRNKGFYENILLAYKLMIDEFKSHFSTSHRKSF